MATKAELEAALQTHHPDWWNNLPPQGAMNAYVCQQEECKRYVITTDRDRGVTPMFIACRTKDGVTTGCKGPMVSSGYPKGAPPKHLGKPTLEWYRPEASPLGFFDSNHEMNQHILKGGLALRPIPKDRRE